MRFLFFITPTYEHQQDNPKVEKIWFLQKGIELWSEPDGTFQ